MTKYDYKCCAIAIGQVVAARQAVEKAREEIEYNFGNGYDGDLDKAWGILNGIVDEINEEMDCETIEEKEEEE